jgi:DNA-binding response OmpR family regulator
MLNIRFMKHKILITDDSNVNRSYLRSILEDKDFEVLDASSGHEALDIVVNSAPDAMILDLMMPGIGGLDILKMIRAKGYKFPIIIFTSDYKEETKKSCLDAGANEVLYKPTKPHHLLSLINELFSNMPTS